MSTPQEISRRWTDAINRGDAAAVAELYAPDGRVWDPFYPEPLEGRDAIQRDLEGFFGAFPDLHAETRSMLEGDRVFASEGMFTGTHDGPLPSESGDIPPTGRTMRLPGASFIRLDGQGRILEERRYYDIAGLLAQLRVTV